MKYIALITALFLLAGCQSIEKNKKADELPENIKYTISLKTNETNVIKDVNVLFENYRIVPLKLNDSLLVSNIDKVIYYQDKFYILDEKFSSLYCFNRNGVFEQKYGAIGLGPKEFKGISDFEIDKKNKRIVLFSNEDQSLIYYRIEDASFLKKVRIGVFGSYLAIQENNFLIYSDYRSHNLLYNVLLLDSTGTILKKYFPFDPKVSKIAWSNFGFLTQSNDTIYCANAFYDTVFVYKNERFVPQTYININSDVINNNKANHDKLFYGNTLIDPQTSLLWNSFLKNGKYIIFNYQSEQRIKICVYNIKNDNLHIITRKKVEDPIINIIGDPLYLDQENNLIFSIKIEDVIDLKEKKMKSMKNLTEENRQIIESLDENSSGCLLITRLKQ